MATAYVRACAEINFGEAVVIAGVVAMLLLLLNARRHRWGRLTTAE